MCAQSGAPCPPHRDHLSQHEYEQDMMAAQEEQYYEDHPYEGEQQWE